MTRPGLMPKFLGKETVWDARRQGSKARPG